MVLFLSVIVNKVVIFGMLD